jgi:general L-amino acid transport system substrate-binding protein
MAKDFEILPEVVAKDPLALTYRLGDAQWAAVIDWIVENLIQSEESGVTEANVEQMKLSEDPVIGRLLGTQHGYGQYLGLDDEWMARVVETVGNYGELFDRDLGMHSPMRLDRGANELSSRGGLMAASPIR